MQRYLIACLAVPLAACSVIPDTPMVGRETAAQGTPVALGEPVWAGDTILTPLSVTEDSRCPVDPSIRCLQAGTITVSTRITATHWAQTAPLTLGKPYDVLGRTYELVSVTPGNAPPTGSETTTYRFVFARK